MSRQAKLERETKETSIVVELDLDGTGQGDIETPIGFLTHMVEQLSRHGLFDLKVRAKGAGGGLLPEIALLDPGGVEVGAGTKAELTADMNGTHRLSARAAPGSPVGQGSLSVRVSCRWRSPKGTVLEKR